MMRARWLPGFLLLALAGCAGVAKPPAAPQDAGQRWLLMLPLPATAADSAADPAAYAAWRRDGPPAAIRRLAVVLARAYGLDLESHWPMDAVGLYCLVVRAEAGAADLQRLAADPRIAWVQPVQRYRVLSHGTRASAAPSARTDPYRSLQHAHASLGLAAAPGALRGAGVHIAVIDSGVDLQHPEFAGRIVHSRDHVADGTPPAEIHGTAVAGIIAAAADNGLGIAGIAPGALLHALRACWEPADGSAAICDSFTLAKALHDALRERVDLINLSLAGPADRLLGRLIERAQAQDIAVIAASAADAKAGFPATMPGVIAVTMARTDSAAIRPRGSPHGSPQGRPHESVTIAAPGDEILSTAPGGGFDFYSGHSFAAAGVTGIAALLKEQAAGLDAGRLAAALAAGVRPDTGVVDACGALQALNPAACKPERLVRHGPPP